MACEKYWEAYDTAVKNLNDATDAADVATRTLDSAMKSYMATIAGFMTTGAISSLGGAAAGSVAAGETVAATTAAIGSAASMAALGGVALIAALAVLILAADAANDAFEIAKEAYEKAQATLAKTTKTAVEALDALCACEAFERDPRNATPPPDPNEIQGMIEEDESEIVDTVADNGIAESASDEAEGLLADAEDAIEEAEQGELSDADMIA